MHETDLHWRESSFNGDAGGGWVEVAVSAAGGRHLRDTKDRADPAHYFTAGDWDAFVNGVKNGEFD